MKLTDLLDRPIAYQRCFVPIAGTVSGAVFLSQLLYWSSRSTITGGWIYKTRKEWQEETGLTRYEQESVRRVLRGKGILFEKKFGVPCKVYFRLDDGVLRNYLHELPSQLVTSVDQLGTSNQPVGGKRPTGLLETSQLDGSKTTNQLAAEQPTNTETTQRVQQRGGKDSPGEDTGKGWTKEQPVPEGLTPLQYAIGVLECCSIPASFQTKQATANAIRLWAKELDIGEHLVASRMQERIEAAKRNGDIVNQFWFEERRYTSDKAAVKGRADGSAIATSEWLARKLGGVNGGNA